CQPRGRDRPTADACWRDQRALSRRRSSWSERGLRRPMQLGSLVTHKGRPYYLRGLDPMSVSDRQAELEDAFTGARVSVPLEEVEERERHDRGRRLTREP